MPIHLCNDSESETIPTQEICEADTLGLFLSPPHTPQATPLTLCHFQEPRLQMDVRRESGRDDLYHHHFSTLTFILFVQYVRERCLYMIPPPMCVEVKVYCLSSVFLSGFPPCFVKPHLPLNLWLTDWLDLVIELLESTYLSFPHPIN